MGKLLVGEPWNFEGPSGPNEILGRVLKQLDPKSLLFKSDEEITIDGRTSCYWLLTTRYQGQVFRSEPYDTDPYRGTVNATILPSRLPEDDDVGKLQASGKFVIVADLYL